jgi:hypothetical protein
MKTGIELMADERQRQIVQEGWNSAHDSRYEGQELVRAAICYACSWERQPRVDGISQPPSLWPWNKIWWKPSPLDRVRELTKAGALIAAEIDRLQAIDNTQNT